MDEVKWETIEGRVDYTYGLEFRSYEYDVAILKSTGIIKNGKITFDVTLDSYNADKKMIFTLNLDNDRENEHLSILFYSDGNIQIWETTKEYNKKLAALRDVEIGQVKLETRIKSRIVIDIYGSVITIFRNGISILNANKSTNYSAQVNANFEGQGFSIVKNFSIVNMKLTAFVIMDFSEQFENIYTKVIKPTCDKQDILCIRADEFCYPGKITSDILKEIKEADIIIAEVTPDNANVYFEFGYAVAFNKQIIPLADENKRKKLPFDTFDIRTIFYENTEQGINTATDKLSNFLMAIKERTYGGSVYRHILMNERERI